MMSSKLHLWKEPRSLYYHQKEKRVGGKKKPNRGSSTFQENLTNIVCSSVVLRTSQPNNPICFHPRQPTQVLSFHPPPPKRHTRTHAHTQTRTKGSLLRYLLKRFDSSIKRRQTAAPSTARLPSVCSRSSGILLLLVLARLPMPSS